MLNNFEILDEICQGICEFSKRQQLSTSYDLINNLFNNLICIVIQFYLMLVQGVTNLNRNNVRDKRDKSLRSREYREIYEPSLHRSLQTIFRILGMLLTNFLLLISASLIDPAATKSGP